ncbi:MAG: DUF1826 domain-containing protein [Gammaproteobacteria bacterium]|nr:DUF1826 domain-containing protein [Gammaproteobacteria bacterium]
MKQSAIISETLVPEPPHIIGHQSSVLNKISDPVVNLVVWQRPTQTMVAAELLTLRSSDPSDMRCPTSLASFDDDVTSLLRQQSLDPSVFKNWSTDLRRLADIYFRVSESRNVTMRLETTNDDGCRRFHVDRTNLRLICTYRGPGTQWLHNEQVNRQAQRAGATNGDIIRFGEPSEIAPFWVGILKGSKYPGSAGQGLVHRSPPIAESGQTRVVFCLDC